ncbi:MULTISPECIES: thioredoxin domain-containing protein [unclassified Microbacterium]|uniref:thioredoxin domain-containing protein n=1 Tax=unclassified Microbacterium TaxID=2609290 RepID=UPI003015A157
MSNRLAGTGSPYLRAHADNPVDWYPWGEEAFAEARRRDVPVLISIGYSTCHWCHVMARESFEDPDTAAQLNGGFVSIKVDREEHPEVDAAYLAAASAFTRDLGWPLTVFATPSGRTFHAGTYFPPVDRGRMPGFRTVLAAVREAWTDRRGEVEAQAGAVAEVLAASAASEAAPLPDERALAAAADEIVAREDRRYGGFGTAPKFPVATTLRFLQAEGRTEVVARALDAMAASELRDEDGGFFRYATQQDWSVPHYERMLIDNAQLLDVAIDAGRADVARGIADSLLAVLQRPGGGFGAAQDSESWIEGQRSEGGYYRVPLHARAQLEPPAVDGKIITGWNGLAIGALARAGADLGESSWIDAAVRAAELVLTVNRDAGGRLVRTSLDGVPSAAVATDADLGLLADGLLALALATGDPRWAARGLEVLAADAVADPVLAGQGIPGSVDGGDGDLPSGASARAAAHLTAWRLGAGEQHRERAAALVRAGAAQALRHPFGSGALLRAAAGLARPPRQIVAVTSDPRGPLAAAVRAADADLAAVLSPQQARAFAEAGFTLFEGRDGVDGVAYDCRGFVCRLPVSDPALVPAAR